MNDTRPLIMHVVYNFDVGGLENGLVNLINRMPEDRYRHVVVALTRCADEFCARVSRKDVEFISLHKSPGHGVWLYPRLYRLFREWQPAVVHTRNLAALEITVPAWAAGIPVRIHGEHGWDASDPDGLRLRYRLVRRLYRPFVTHYVALSGHLQAYLCDGVGVPQSRVTRICNGVDAVRFHPAPGGLREAVMGSPFNATDLTVIGTVGRLQSVKDQVNLVRAFALLCARAPNMTAKARLMIVGDGPQRRDVEAEVARSGVGDRIWLAGECHDVPATMRGMDIFALPSRAEGISNTILEAMASGLPVIATSVGGNPELVVAEETGSLVPAADSAALASELARYVADPVMARERGRAGRVRVEQYYSLSAMVERYARLYDFRLGAAGQPVPAT